MFQLGEESVAPPRAQFDRHDVRFIGVVSGRYALPARRSGVDGKVAIYACRLCSISTRLAVVVGPVVGAVGEVVTAHFDEFGILRGKITRKLPSGFVLELILTEPERNKLGAKVVWMKRHVHGQVPDKREHKRILPRDPRTILTLADGTQLPCFVIDISQSGIAVSAELWPGLGTPMAVGKLVGRVVRHLDTGFALQFIQVHDFATLEVLMAPPVAQ
ncbi:PilZ domain-containing protein [Devosia sp. YR412]|uniref:PilZ domain-containing protein n=1 Tax=Devosia sp. YR412 TaxID=1881030 RepID=UPI0008CF8074|nr:PilZ domain-containing protein [Devosia sp. YR412]SEQ38890.1 PilZ domain-containing protein [Devosia sp. YR412]